MVEVGLSREGDTELQAPGRSPGFRLKRIRLLPDSEPVEMLRIVCYDNSPVTVARPRRILTAFPIPRSRTISNVQLYRFFNQRNNGSTRTASRAAPTMTLTQVGFHSSQLCLPRKRPSNRP